MKSFEFDFDFDFILKILIQIIKDNKLRNNRISQNLLMVYSVIWLIRCPLLFGKFGQSGFRQLRARKLE